MSEISNISFANLVICICNGAVVPRIFSKSLLLMLLILPAILTCPPFNT